MAFTPSKLIWMNGKLVPWDEARIHVLSHVVHYGSSVFEGIRCYDTKRGPAVFRLREHVRRLFDSAKIYRMPMPFTAEQIVARAYRSLPGSFQPAKGPGGHQPGCCGRYPPVHYRVC